MQIIIAQNEGGGGRGKGLNLEIIIRNALDRNYGSLKDGFLVHELSFRICHGNVSLLFFHIFFYFIFPLLYSLECIQNAGEELRDVCQLGPSEWQLRQSPMICPFPSNFPFVAAAVANSIAVAVEEQEAQLGVMDKCDGTFYLADLLGSSSMAKRCWLKLNEDKTERTKNSSEFRGPRRGDGLLIECLIEWLIVGE